MKNRFIYSIGQSIDGLKSDCQKYQTMEMIDSSHRNSNFNEFPEEEKGLVHLPNLKLSWISTNYCGKILQEIIDSVTGSSL